MPSYVPPAHANPLDLRSPFLKVKRAKNHIRDIDRERIAFSSSNTHFGIPKYNVETNTTQFILGETPEIDFDIRLLLGDAVHNLRTALDHLACELARSVGVKDPMDYFPIFETRDIYEAKSPGKTKGIPQEAKTFIDQSICPYGGEDDLLWGLHGLDRIDKHRLLLAVTTVTRSWGASLGSEAKLYQFSFIPPAMKAGEVIGEVEGNHESDTQMSITADIAFGEPEVLKGQTLFPILPIIAEHVEGILLKFGPNPL